VSLPGSSLAEPGSAEAEPRLSLARALWSLARAYAEPCWSLCGARLQPRGACAERGGRLDAGSHLGSTQAPPRLSRGCFEAEPRSLQTALQSLGGASRSLLGDPSRGSTYFDERTGKLLGYKLLVVYL
jgi:hypothetical protein